MKTKKKVTLLIILIIVLFLCFWFFGGTAIYSERRLARNICNNLTNYYYPEVVSCTKSGNVKEIIEFYFPLGTRADVIDQGLSGYKKTSTIHTERENRLQDCDEYRIDHYTFYYELLIVDNGYNFYFCDGELYMASWNN